MSEPNDETITPQEPGVTPLVEIPKLEAVLACKANDIPGALDAQVGDELFMLRTLEVQGKARPTVLKAIDTVIGSREVDESLGQEIQGTSQANLGDRERYARMHAKDVDNTQLAGPVLTLDGWVLPLPKAQG